MTNTSELQPKAADYMTIEDDNLAVEALLNIRMVSDLFINADKTGVTLRGATLVTIGGFLKEAADAIVDATGIEA